MRMLASIRGNVAGILPSVGRQNDASREFIDSMGTLGVAWGVFGSFGWDRRALIPRSIDSMLQFGCDIDTIG
jgi:hypothetical protein